MLETYDIYETLGANSQQKNAKVRRAGVHEIDFVMKYLYCLQN